MAPMEDYDDEHMTTALLARACAPRFDDRLRPLLMGAITHDARSDSRGGLRGEPPTIHHRDIAAARRRTTFPAPGVRLRAIGRASIVACATPPGGALAMDPAGWR